jgi:hypothetical protein
MEENKRPLYRVIIGVVVLLLILGGAGTYALTKSKKNNIPNDSPKTEIIPTPTPEFLTYTDSSGKFSMQYASGWVQDTTYQALVVMFKSPKESENDAYLENVNLGKQESSDPKYTVDNYNEYAKYSLQGTLENFKIVKEDKIKIDGVDAVNLLFTSTSSGKPARTLQRYVIKDGFVYVMAYTGYEESFAKFEEKGLKSLDSFKFIQS